MNESMDAYLAAVVVCSFTVFTILILNVDSITKFICCSTDDEGVVFADPIN